MRLSCTTCPKRVQSLFIKFIKQLLAAN
uniref:Uncharacterized protein n=1 Tax=Rhizophora mucronata TaxID=61149 RepID=A0A2P2R1D9_RHIMU